MSIRTAIKACDIMAAWHVLEQARASGLLCVRSGGLEASITFRAGFAVAAKSGNGARIGDALVQHGVTEATVDSALRLQKRLKNPRPLGAVLVDLGLVGATTVREILRVQCRGIIESCRRDGRGELEFQAADEDAVLVGPDGGVSFLEITDGDFAES